MRVQTMCSVLVIYIATLPKGTLAEYYGKFIGDISTHAHDFSAKVYAVSDNKVGFVDLTYDGTGPAARFWIGPGAEGPSIQNGIATVDENGSDDVLKAYNKQNIVLTLPSKITDYGFIGILCTQANESFGEVFIPPGFSLPAATPLGQLTGNDHNISASDVTLMDSAVIELKNFHYDGAAPAVHFAVGKVKGDSPDHLTKLLNEYGRDTKLGRYSGKTVTIKLMTDHHWNEYEWFTVYCFHVNMSFASLDIEKSVAESLPVHDPLSFKYETPPRAKPTTVGRRSSSPGAGGKAPGKAAPSTEAPATEEKEDFPTVIVVGVAVGVLVCISTSVFLFWFRSSDKLEPVAEGVVAEGGAATGAAAAGTGTGADAA